MIIDINAIILDRGIDWFIENTKKIIIRYSQYKGIKHNENIVKRYSDLLKKLEKIKKDSNGI